MKNSKQDSIIRVGDKVLIKEPILFERVGYDNSFQSNYKSTDEEYGTKVRKFILNDLNMSMDKFLYGKIISAINYEVTGRKKKSGAERKIFNKPDRYCYLKGREIEVSEIKFVKTGKYVPPYNSQDYYGEWDFEPGGLTEEKTHKILTLDNGDMIESIYVEKVILESNIDSGDGSSSGSL